MMFRASQLTLHRLKFVFRSLSNLICGNDYPCNCICGYTVAKVTTDSKATQKYVLLYSKCLKYLSNSNQMATPHQLVSTMWDSVRTVTMIGSRHIPRNLAIGNYNDKID